MDNGTLPSGRLLGREEIRRRASKGDIFGEGTYREKSIRGAAYDLRLASDFLITPDGRAFGPKQLQTNYNEKYLILKPGDVVFVASLEKLQLEWNITANIAPKYDLAREGLFLLYGGFVDPGYGRMRGPDGEWMPRDDERLQFVIANLSASKRVLQPGEQPIATLQFFEVEQIPDEHREEIRSAVVGWEATAEDPIRLLGAMAFFERTTKETNKLSEAIQSVDDKTKVLEQRAEHTDKTNERVVAFGIYVMAAALLGGAFAVLVALFGSTHSVIKVHFDGLGKMNAGGALLLVGVIAGGIVLGALIVVFGLWLSGYRPRKSASAGT